MRRKAMCVKAALARLVIAVCGVIVYGVVSGTADAQPVSGGLKHLSEVRLAVENVEEEARACGIRNEILDTAVRGPLLNSSLGVVPQARDFVYVAIAAIRPLGVCAANVTLEVNRWSSEFNDFVTVWRRGLVMSSDPSSFVAEASDAIQLNTRELISDWQRANP